MCCFKPLQFVVLCRSGSGEWTHSGPFILISQPILSADSCPLSQMRTPERSKYSPKVEQQRRDRPPCGLSWGQPGWGLAGSSEPCSGAGSQMVAQRGVGLLEGQGPAGSGTRGRAPGLSCGQATGRALQGPRETRLKLCSPRQTSSQLQTILCSGEGRAITLFPPSPEPLRLLTPTGLCP